MLSYIQIHIYALLFFIILYTEKGKNLKENGDEDSDDFMWVWIIHNDKF